MKTTKIVAAVAAVIACWATQGFAQQTIVITPPYTFGPNPLDATGQASGIRTTGPGTLIINPNINVNTTNNAGGGITSNAANTANIVFSGNSTVTGFTGTAGNTFLNISAGAAGSTVNFNGAVFSTTINVTGTGTLNFNGSVVGAPNFAGDGFINLGAGQSLTGAVITATANTGTFTLNGGSSVIGAMGGANGLKMINVVGGNAAITGAVQTLGFNLGANTLNITGAFTTNTGGTIATTLNSNSVFGRIIPTGAASYTGGITVTPTVTGPLTVGTTFTIVNAGSGTNVPISVVNNNPLFTFTGATTTAGLLNIVLASAAPLSSVVSSPVAPALGQPATPGSDLATVQNAIFALPGLAAINNAVAQLAPGTANLAAPRAAGQASQMFDDMWMARVEEIQDLCCDTNCDPAKAAPARPEKCKSSPRNNWWGKVYDTAGRQGDRDNLNGYRSNAIGVMLAYDVPVNNETRVGFGGGYANTRVDGNNIGGNTSVDSYQLTAYASHTPGPVFVQGSLSAGWDKYDGSRPIVFPGISRTAASDYNGSHVTALVSTGKHFYFGQNTLTPLASLQASRVHVGSYTETGAGDVDLRVNSQDYNFVQSSLGAKVERLIQSGSATYAPEVHARWLHDFSSTTMQQTAAFTGGGSNFFVQGVSQDRELFNVGTGVTFLSCKCGERSWTAKGVYDYKWNQSSYSSHQVSLIVSTKF